MCAGFVFMGVNQINRQEQSPSKPADIHPAVAFIQKEWRVIKTFAFWVAIGLVAVGLFFVMQWHYGETINTKDTTIELLTQERDQAIKDGEKLKAKADAENQAESQRDTYKGQLDVWKERADKLEHSNDQFKEDGLREKMRFEASKYEAESLSESLMLSKEENETIRNIHGTTACDDWTACGLREFQLSKYELSIKFFALAFTNSTSKSFSIYLLCATIYLRSVSYK